MAVNSKLTHYKIRQISTEIDICAYRISQKNHSSVSHYSELADAAQGVGLVQAYAIGLAYTEASASVGVRDVNRQNAESRSNSAAMAGGRLFVVLVLALPELL